MADGDAAVDKATGWASKLAKIGLKVGKWGAITTSVMTAFALVANPAGAVTLGAAATAKAAAISTAAEVGTGGVGAAIMAGKYGLFQSGWEAIKFYAMEVVPFSFTSVDEILTAFANTMTWGAGGAAEMSQWAASHSTQPA